jgi:hypothetical protein
MQPESLVWSLLDQLASGLSREQNHTESTIIDELFRRRSPNREGEESFDIY